jgi:hypothetical protein
MLFSYHGADMSDVALRGVSAEVHRALRDAAERNHRSLNGEILARLEASFRPTPTDVVELLARIRERGRRTQLASLSDAAMRELERAGRE